MKESRHLRNIAAAVCCALALAVLTAGAVPAAEAAAAPKIESVDYEGSGKVDVEFVGDVEFGSTKVTVKDADGNSYKTTILKTDDDDIRFKVKSAKAGREYTFKITKVRRLGSSSYKTVKGSFRIPSKNEVRVEDVEYDAGDREVSFDFYGFVRWKKPKVTITDDAGKNMVRKIADRDREELEVKVKKLTSGKTYQYKITGVAREGQNKYKTVTGTFTVR